MLYDWEYVLGNLEHTAKVSRFFFASGFWECIALRTTGTIVFQTQQANQGTRRQQLPAKPHRPTLSCFAQAEMSEGLTGKRTWRAAFCQTSRLDILLDIEKRLTSRKSSAPPLVTAGSGTRRGRWHFVLRVMWLRVYKTNSKRVWPGREEGAPACVVALADFRVAFWCKAFA
jgi:hypothetical protein